MDSVAVRIEVLGEDLADADRRANELSDWLGSRDITLQRERKDQLTMNLGTVLIALLSTPAVVALAKDPAVELAKGIADWLRKRSGSITVDGITVENADQKTIERIVRLAMKKSGPRVKDV